MKAGQKDWIGFGITSAFYLAWVIWLGVYWFLAGFVVIFDGFISQKVHWTFWKKRNGRNSIAVEWLDAIIFAVIAVTFINIFLFQNYKIPSGSMEKTLMTGDHLYVSKMAYGPRTPNTPIAFPFVQHTMPFTRNVKSFSTWIQWPYKRLAGFGAVKRNDPVVFNFPEGDTVVIGNETLSYYTILRKEASSLKESDIEKGISVKSEKEYLALARTIIWKNNDIAVRPIDKRENYIKRCVAIPGDTLRIIDKRIYINGIRQKDFPGMQYSYYIYLRENQDVNDAVLDEMGINEHYHSGNVIQTWLTQKELNEISKLSSIQQIIPNSFYEDYSNIYYFPHNPAYPWTPSDFGPLYIPKKGATIPISIENLCLYERIITQYEHNTLTEKDGKIYINNAPATEYTFKMNYYWMMGDNRERSLDSRFWGLVPEDHIVGKPKFVWLSFNKGRRFPQNIRWDRIMKRI